MEYCGNMPLGEYTQLNAYDLSKAMDALDFSNAQIKKMITYGRGVFRYAIKNCDINGKKFLTS